MLTRSGQWHILKRFQLGGHNQPLGVPNEKRCAKPRTDGYPYVCRTEHRHRLGDQILMTIGQRLTVLIKQKVTVARLDGDKFGLWVPGQIVHPSLWLN
ncbi:diguanylate cyclase domain-containing protein [Marinobacter psychrophilus]|uniref:diguanylate cyclase domain-containing protein n=1 Tax=Marinobacter psychrophilus TaxID=330734 RepID=UPI002354613F|nr:diguanylate cyclase [Marinobacter psychrophilus]